METSCPAAAALTDEGRESLATLVLCAEALRAPAADAATLAALAAQAAAEAQRAQDEEASELPHEAAPVPPPAAGRSSPAGLPPSRGKRCLLCCPSRPSCMT